MRLVALASCIFLSQAAFAANRTQERLNDAATLISEIMATPDRSIPQDLLEKAHCIVVVPGVKKAAFGFGGKWGRGFISCRAKSGVGWSAPGAVRLEGGSFGFQIGVSSTDVVLLVMNERGMDKLLTSKFTLGGDATVAGGPVGRATSAQTDALMRAEILSWSRSRGAFAGVSLEGATLRNDLDENQAMYGKKLNNRQVVMGRLPVPASAKVFIGALNKYSMRKG
ncbi:MAG: lipid-binding SYLF domain-containing protein [Acidobacteria bacterium]|nr:lipid-binding SYLF domain-containing protein [Acidobacteriota bacterium]